MYIISRAFVNVRCGHAARAAPLGPRQQPHMDEQHRRRGRGEACPLRSTQQRAVAASRPWSMVVIDQPHDAQTQHHLYGFMHDTHATYLGPNAGRALNEAACQLSTGYSMYSMLLCSFSSPGARLLPPYTFCPCSSTTTSCRPPKPPPPPTTTNRRNRCNRHNHCSGSRCRLQMWAPDAGSRRSL